MGAESSTMQNVATTCQGCKNLGDKHVDTVKVDMSKLPEASATGKENSSPGQMTESRAEKSRREERQRLNQAEEEEARRRAEEEAKKQRQLVLEMHTRQEEAELRKRQAEQERQRLAEEEEAQIAEQKRRQGLEEERLRRIQKEKEEEEQQRLFKQKEEEEAAAARRQAEEEKEARRNESLRAFLGKAGFGAVGEKKVKKSLMSSSFSYPLHAAVDLKDAEAVSLLLWAGADPKLPNSKKLTPLKLAEAKNKQGSHDKVIAALAA